MSSSESGVREAVGKCVAAGGASVLAVLVTTPLDVVKNRMQAQHASGLKQRVFEEAIPQRYAVAGCPAGGFPRIGTPAISTICPPECYVYQSTLDGLRKIAKHEGLNALWRGVREGIVISIPMVGIYMPLYDWMVQKFSGLGHYAPVVAGSASRTISLFFVAPLDMLRLRMQVATGMLLKDSSGKAMGGVTNWRNFDWGQNKGIVGKTRALWRGYGATVARDVPFSGLYWGMLEPIRRNLMANYTDGDPTMVEVVSVNAVAGGIAGSLSAGITTPLDVVKTRQQIMSEGNPRPPSFYRCLINIGKNEGLNGLFSGVGPRCFRSVPSCAIVLSTYELLKKMV